MSNVAERLITESAKSREAEAWISRQLFAGRRPCEIMDDLRRATDPVKVIAAMGGDGPAGLTFACVVMFALPFALLGWVLP